MPTNCVVPGCKRFGGHNFPRDKSLAQKWLKAVRRESYVPTKHTKICKAHFLATDYQTEGYFTGLKLVHAVLKKDAVPSVFNWDEYLANKERGRRSKATISNQEWRTPSRDSGLSNDVEIRIVDIKKLLKPYPDNEASGVNNRRSGDVPHDHSVDLADKQSLMSEMCIDRKSTLESIVIDPPIIRLDGPEHKLHLQSIKRDESRHASEKDHEFCETVGSDTSSDCLNQGSMVEYEIIDDPKTDLILVERNEEREELFEKEPQLELETYFVEDCCDIQEEEITYDYYNQKSPDESATNNPSIDIVIVSTHSVSKPLKKEEMLNETSQTFDYASALSQGKFT